MTREEAILWLQVLKHAQINWVGEQAEDEDIIARCEESEQEAFDMAIEALSKPNYETDTEVILMVTNRKKEKVILWDAFGEVEYVPSALLKQEIEFHKKVSRIEAEQVVDLEHKLSDMVSVVRCEDCRFAMIRTEEEMNKTIKPQPILCEWFCIGVENDDYCSHGERGE